MIKNKLLTILIMVGVVSLAVQPYIASAQTPGGNTSGVSVLISENFDSAIEGGIPEGWAQDGFWGAAYVGSEFGTVLYGDYPHIPYLGNSTGNLSSPVQNLSGATSAHIDFATRCDTEYAPNTDFMTLRVSGNGGTSWQNLVSWNEATIDTDTNPEGTAVRRFSNIAVPSELLTANFKLGFTWATNAADSDYDGCFIDDVTLTKVGADDGGGGNNGGNTGTAPTTAIVSVDGDTTAPYTSAVNNPVVVISGAAGMSCRWGLGDSTYANMSASNEITVNGTNGQFTVNPEGMTGNTVYVSCRGGDGTEQTVAQNLDISFTVNTGGNNGGNTGTSLTACTTLADEGATYTLANDINTAGSCFTINANNITLDGNGHAVIGDDGAGDSAVTASGKTGITIKNLHAEHFDKALNLTSVNNSTITANTFLNNTYGIALTGSGNQITNNTTSDNGNNGIYVSDGSNNTVDRNTTSNNSVGIQLNNASANIVSNNTTNQNDRGILLTESSNNAISSNTVNQNSFGIAIENQGGGNTLSNNTVGQNDVGVAIGTGNNTLNGLTISGSGSKAIRFFETNSTDNVINNTTISNTTGLDVSFDATGENYGPAAVDGTVFNNTSIGKYAISVPGKITVKNGNGEVAFTSAIMGNGDNLTNDVKIENGTITIANVFNNSSQIKFKNVTIANPQVMKNGAVCTDCTGTTVTTGTESTVTFNAAGAGTYTLSASGGGGNDGGNNGGNNGGNTGTTTDDGGATTTPDNNGTTTPDTGGLEPNNSPGAGSTTTPGTNTGTTTPDNNGTTTPDNNGTTTPDNNGGNNNGTTTPDNNGTTTPDNNGTTTPDTNTSTTTPTTEHSINVGAGVVDVGLPNTGGGTTSTSDGIRADINGDGVVNMLDFNALMAAWGTSGGNNASDINRDGLVDIRDFNLLMVHWSN